MWFVKKEKKGEYDLKEKYDCVTDLEGIDLEKAKFCYNTALYYKNNNVVEYRKFLFNSVDYYKRAAMEYLRTNHLKDALVVYKKIKDIYNELREYRKMKGIEKTINKIKELINKNTFDENDKLRNNLSTLFKMIEKEKNPLMLAKYFREISYIYEELGEKEKANYFKKRAIKELDTYLYKNENN